MIRPCCALVSVVLALGCGDDATGADSGLGDTAVADTAVADTAADTAIDSATRDAGSRPSIDRVDPLVHGTPFTVFGSRFGIKDSAPPVVWDDVEDGAFEPAWNSTHDLAVLSAGDNQRHARSLACGTANMSGDGGQGDAYFTSPNSSLGESWFVQYWFKMHDNFDWGAGGWLPSDERGPEYDANLANIKLFRMWNPAGSARENFVVATMGYAGGAIQYNTENVADANGRVGFESIFEWDTGVWHLFQFEYRESAVDTNDGVFRWWVDGVILAETETIKTRESEPEFKRPFIVGFFNSWGDANSDRDDFYIDDIYVDNSWARVEICSASPWTARGLCEIQVPQSWADDQIVLTANQGQLASGDTVYLYVVDREGVANSEGIGVTFE